MSEETLSFQAEVSKLLDIVVHSLYSDRKIFLRELISNASDACDKLRYEGLTQPALLEGDGAFRIRLSIDAEAGTLTIADNGIGMNRHELIENLGTIARSGTQAFAEALKAKSQAASGDVSLIGQFGVGFYSAFMVADKVEVVTRRAGEAQGWRWSSDGKGSFSVSEVEGAGRGAAITLHLREDARDFLDEHRLREIVKTYSDHIAIPVDYAGKEGEPERLNEASALWTRPRDQITDEQYAEFYHHVAHGFETPWHTLHYRAEGKLEYTALLFVPGQQPFDLFTQDRKPRVKLYVNRVFITDDCEELLPSYLRFVRGVVDSSDLPLNVSREMLQDDPRLRKIKGGLTKRLIDDLAKRARDDESAYLTFWENFGAVLKEGIYEDFERKEDLVALARFRTTASDTPVSLETVIGRMKEGQSALYYITGDDATALARSPQVEGFVARGVEVLLLTDPIDEFWVSAVPKVGDTALKAVAQGSADLERLALIDGKQPPDDAEHAPAETAKMDALIAAMKAALGTAVADVRVSARLTDSPVCLVAKEGAMSLHLQKLLRQANQGSELSGDRVLEINPRHALVKTLAERAATGGSVDEAALLLMDQARILEGEAPADAIAFARRLTEVMGKGLI
ncbi:molecular chaperone HtpG [Rhodospirillum rubrum]|uniref:Chaperone protein HtpG n=1 Tax=Rhodospirillum rubrum (strain ATCC 11170 / ATH 1.1.1 / DSM 467 / LMG 4362 / NCIMB 8255 / S1) TaxID=269796 RepID=HTPG_RHORT|nr:molecular chaperone HtpG [Rhodospirillum rubrum]Q2RYB8.1 RecName: Full=Chaperone protein HtpG; AltName: Full=Heat shock protein HtpG; AltName: Full=High temperature protein G [Rhodospirillum rubrum ATCC 11170]ABC20877.1 chaperone protein Hsp90 [Rhodospirillum rubrum ATCC 11170]AEO46545.1 heat shock protein 90 [Rhodospirillum rubrum F11]MBK5952435.1 molecular chaperone HtpG [Rhodospirillum rubrum]QXG80579.1 molecular chaperone HtpG [Rhodospirillum rubrum]HCF17941.1 molecular chaperone HtpG 